MNTKSIFVIKLIIKGEFYFAQKVYSLRGTTKSLAGAMGFNTLEEASKEYFENWQHHKSYVIELNADQMEGFELVRGRIEKISTYELQFGHRKYAVMGFEESDKFANFWGCSVICNSELSATKNIQMI